MGIAGDRGVPSAISSAVEKGTYDYHRLSVSEGNSP